MITEEVIKEIYKNYNKTNKDEEQLRLPYFAQLLSAHHKLNIEDIEVVVESVEEGSPFRRFLKRAICAVLEFDRDVAFVFKTHIIFFSKRDSNITVHIRKEKQGILDKIFGSKED